MKQPKISIIVPVYNAERYLTECIDSILHQSYLSFELILVDDGSKDASGTICDEYAANEDRVRVVHQENKGSSAARQVGFEQAHGEYIVAIDSDDWVDAYYLEDMLQIMENEQADIVMSAYWFNCDGADMYMANKPIKNDVFSWQVNFLDNRCHAGLWNKMFKRSIVQSGKLYVPQYSYYEDMAISLSYTEQCEKLSYNCKAAYHYRYNEYSLTNDTDVHKRLLRLQEMINNMKGIYQHLSIEKQKKMEPYIQNRVNSVKWELISQYPITYLLNKKIFQDYCPLQYKWSNVTGKKTLCYWLLAHKISLPFILMVKLKYNHKNYAKTFNHSSAGI